MVDALRSTQADPTGTLEPKAHLWHHELCQMLRKADFVVPQQLILWYKIHERFK